MAIKEDSSATGKAEDRAADIKRRVGRFSIALDLIDAEPIQLRDTIFSRCIVLRAEALWHARVIEYIARSEDFDVAPECAEVPCYMARMRLIEDEHGRRVVFDRWVRQ